MGLFGRKKKPHDELMTDYSRMTVDEAIAASRGGKIAKEDLSRLTSELCDQVTYLRAQQEETKNEYAQVTQYLADIQRYEQMDEESRGEIADAARMMLSLENERVRFQTGEKRIRDDLYHTMEMYEHEFPKKLGELEKHENFLVLIKDDMRNLEGEKGSISYEKEHAESKRNFLNKMSYAIVLVVLLIFITLIVLSGQTGKDFTVPFFITGVAAIGYIIYYIMAVGECKKDVKKTEYMMNRANMLLNKVKIKYVNTTSVLDYSYDKYGVNSLQELRYVWENYVRQKEAEKRYMKNTQLLNSYTERMARALSAAGMEKTDAWVSQPEVLLDRTELVDFKDAVSRRRNKLRARLDYNIRQQDSALNDIEALKAKYIGQEKLITAILHKNGID